MAQYHLNNIPDDLMEHIRLRAAKRRGTMRDYLLDLVRDDMHDYFTTIDPSPRVGSETRGPDFGKRILR